MTNNSFKEILVFVAGGTPQIITETIYALAQQPSPIYPDQIYVITTGPGKQKAIDTLLDGGVLANLCLEYNIPSIVMNENSFITLTDGNGKVFDDIRTVEANEIAGDQVTHILRSLSAQPNSRLHCVLSGGRRSMSYFMGVAFQLFARQWDKLYHVLVSPEFGENPNFYYKPKHNQQINGRSHCGHNQVLNTDDAEISLIELPLIFLRDKISVNGTAVRDMVAQGQKHIDTATMQLPIQVNFADRCIYIGDNSIELLPIQLMIYATFLRVKLAKECIGLLTHCYECNSCFILLADIAHRKSLESMALDYERMYSSNPFKRDELLDKWKEGLEIDLLRQHISKINRAIKEQLDDATLLPFYKIDTIKQYGRGRYGVRVEKEKITIE